MADVPGTTLNSIPQWNNWLAQLQQNRATRALPMFTYNSNTRPMLTPQDILQSRSIPGVSYGRPDMPRNANLNIPDSRPLPEAPHPYIPRLPVNNNALPPIGGGLPLMAPPLIGHPVGLRDREKSILDRFEND